MKKTQPTPTRASRNAERRALRDTMRAYFDGRLRAAEKRRKARAKLAEKAAKRNARKGLTPRGVDRVPESIRTAPTRTILPHQIGKVRNGIEPSPIYAEDNPRGNYRDRRAQGQRGKPRRTRRRDMPGAVERRLERRRGEWAGGAR